MTLQEMLSDLGACREAREWAAQFGSLAEAWQACQRGDWMAWFAAMMAGEPGWPTHREVVLAMCACAEEALPLCLPKERMVAQNALAVARRWARGEATVAEVRAAARDAYDAAERAVYYAGVGIYDAAASASGAATDAAANAAAIATDYSTASSTAFVCANAVTSVAAAYSTASTAAIAATVNLNDASARGDFRTMFRDANTARDASLATSADICRRMLKIPSLRRTRNNEQKLHSA